MIPPRPQPQPQGPDLNGATQRALVGGGVIGLLAVIFLVIFWPAGVLLAIVAAVYGYFLATGMPLAAGPEITIAHARFVWHTRLSGLIAKGPAFEAQQPQPQQPEPQQQPQPRPAAQPAPQQPQPRPAAQHLPPRPAAQPQPRPHHPSGPLHRFTASQASNPATAQATLADIAARAPELRRHVAENPSTYPGLLDWLGTYGDQEVKDAVARRRSTGG